MAKSKANNIDAAIGARIRAARREAGLSQEKLGAALGMTFQQIQKYELGVNKVGGSRFEAIARATGKPVSWFFSQHDGKSGAAETDLITQMLCTPHGVEVARSFLKLADNEDRITVARVVAAMAR